jgi:hypothetical protein
MDALDKVIASSVILGERSMEPLDAYGDLTVQHFVDLLSAVHDDHILDFLVAQLRQAIISSQIKLSKYNAVVSPKMGNVLLGRFVKPYKSQAALFAIVSYLADTLNQLNVPAPNCY